MPAASIASNAPLKSGLFKSATNNHHEPVQMTFENTKSALLPAQKIDIPHAFVGCFYTHS
jgi:hypothetical protein